MKTLTINELNIETNKNLLIKNLSFSLEKGEKTIIMGKSGSGKTVLMLSILNLYKEYTGHVKFLDRDVNLSVLRSQKIGIIFQRPLIDFKLTLRENLETFKLLYNSSANIDNLVHKFNLENYMDKSAYQVSTKIRRKIDLLRVLFYEQELVIMDEPTMGLDKHFKLIFWHLLNEKISNGTSILYSNNGEDDMTTVNKINLDTYKIGT